MSAQQNALAAPRQGLNMRRFLDDWVMVLAALGIFVLSAIFIDNFLSPLNMRGLGLAISTVGIAACTMLFCLASGHFDLSVGSVIACAGVVAAVVPWNMPQFLTITKVVPALLARWQAAQSQ